jgi:hypothetical protein
VWECVGRGGPSLLREKREGGVAREVGRGPAGGSKGEGIVKSFEWKKPRRTLPCQLQHALDQFKLLPCPA